MICDCGKELPPACVEPPEPVTEPEPVEPDSAPEPVEPAPGEPELVKITTAPKRQTLAPHSVFLSYTGRITRSTFWIGVLLLILIFVSALLLIDHNESLVLWLFYLFPLCIWSYYALCAKRWHDQDKSGWWSLLIFIPLFGGIIMPLGCGIPDGTPGSNKYGAEPSSYGFVQAIGRRLS